MLYIRFEATLCPLGPKACTSDLSSFCMFSLEWFNKLQSMIGFNFLKYKVQTKIPYCRVKYWKKKIPGAFSLGHIISNII